MTTTSTQTRQHPTGAWKGQCGTCPTCGPHEVVFGDPDSQLTYSTAPNPDGRYVVQGHADWCPVWTGETPEIPAPCCGAPVVGYSFTAGQVLVVAGPSAAGEPVDERVEDTPENLDRYWTLTPRREAAPRFDRAILDPCGHQVKDGEARMVVAAVDAAVRLGLAAEAEAALAEHAAILDAAQARGHGVLVARYRDAVLRRSDEATGLLVALRTLVSS